MICLECGERRQSRLMTHPVTPGDQLCVDCCINWHEEEIDSHQCDLDALYKKQAKFDAEEKKAIDGKRKGCKDSK